MPSSPLSDGRTAGRARHADMALVPVLLVGVVTARLMPEHLAQTGPTLCPFRLLTNFPCPACGLIRSWAHTAHGDLAAAVYDHPAGPVLMALAVVVIVRAVVRGRLPRLSAGTQRWAIGGAASLAVFGLVRAVLVGLDRWPWGY